MAHLGPDSRLGDGGGEGEALKGVSDMDIGVCVHRGE